MSENEKPTSPTNSAPKPMPKKAPVPTRPKPTGSSRPPVKNPGIKPKPTQPVQPKKPVSNVSPVAAGPMPVKPKVNKVDTKNVDVKDTKNDDSKENKKKKRKKFLLLLLFLLIFFVAISVAIYFLANIQREELNFTIDMRYFVQNEEVDPVTGETQRLKLLPGQTLPATLLIQIRNQDLIKSTNKKVFLRFKIDIEVDNNSYIGLFDPILNEPEKWFRGDDGYYYYNNIIYGTEKRMTAFETLDFVSDRSNNVLNGKSGNLTFTVEILEGNFAAISQHWSTAPTRWRQTVK